MSYIEIPANKLTVSPFNIRHLTKFQLETQLEGIKDSIKSNGIIQPLVVRKVKNKYEIVTGQIRFLAGKKILKKFPCIVKEISDKEATEYSLIENLQRKDIDPLDVAKGLKQLKEMLPGVTFEQIGKKIGLTRKTIWQYLSLLGLAPEVQEMVSSNKLSAKMASKLSTIEEKKQKEVAELLSKTPTDNESEELIRRAKQEPEKDP
ncbi:MAG: ParB/RepB/Spo0J family partition protein, partial [Nanoarchaeota archaeon]